MISAHFSMFQQKNLTCWTKNWADNLSIRYTLYCQKYSLTCFDSHANLIDIPFLIHRVKYVSPPFAAITASTLLGRLFTGFRSVLWECLTILPEVHLWGHTLMLKGKAWLSVSALIHPKGLLSDWSQDSVQASQVHPHQTLSSMSLWTLLCALVHSHVGTGRGHPKTVPSSWKTALCHNSPSTKLYTWHNAVRQVPFSWQMPNPDSCEQPILS